MIASSDAGTRAIHLHLLIPGLLEQATAGESGGSGTETRTPALDTLLSRATRRTTTAGSMEAVIFSLFDIDIPVGADIPVAAVTRVLDLGVIDKGWWLRADPVHLHPERDRLILNDSRILDITQDEADRLVTEIMEVYGPDGWRLKAPRPDRWYLKPRRAARITTTPLAEVVGRDIHPCLPQGKDGMAWHAALNEIQILLHTANVNAEREQIGKLPINSLWFWGGGKLPSIKPARWTQVWSQESVSLSLARLAEVATAGVPNGYAEWVRMTQKQGEHLVVFDGARSVVDYDEENSWSTRLCELEQNWMDPLLRALKANHLASMTLYTDHGRCFRCSARDTRRWWRRRRPLSAFR
jgi:hypothetical protein